MYTYFNMCLPFAVDEDDKGEMPMNANTQLPDEWSLVPWEYTAVCRYWAHMIITCGSAVIMPVGIGRVFHGYRNLFLGSEVVYGAWNQLGVIMEAIGSDGGPTVFYTAVPSTQFPDMALAGAICRTHGFGYIFLKQDVAEVDARAQNQWGEDELGWAIWDDPGTSDTTKLRVEFSDAALQRYVQSGEVQFRGTNRGSARWYGTPGHESLPMNLVDDVSGDIMITVTEQPHGAIHV
jgi:hypothetical protein